MVFLLPCLQVSDFSWSHDGRMALICYKDGFVLVGSVTGQRYWSSLLDLDAKLLCGAWAPDDKQVVFLRCFPIIHFFMPLTCKGAGGIMFSGCPSVRRYRNLVTANSQEPQAGFFFYHTWPRGAP